MRIKIDLESDDLIDGLLIYIRDDQSMGIYKDIVDFENGGDGILKDVNIKTEFLCPSCEVWTDSENWTGEYICQNCAWDSLETEAYGEILE